jgi:cytidylate kinase
MDYEALKVDNDEKSHDTMEHLTLLLVRDRDIRDFREQVETLTKANDSLKMANNSLTVAKSKYFKRSLDYHTTIKDHKR